MDTNCTPKPLEFSKLEKATVSSARVVFISGKLTPTYEWGMSSKQDNQASWFRKSSWSETSTKWSSFGAVGLDWGNITVVEANTILSNWGYICQVGITISLFFPLSSITTTTEGCSSKSMSLSRLAISTRVLKIIGESGVTPWRYDPHKQYVSYGVPMAYHFLFCYFVLLHPYPQTLLSSQIQSGYIVSARAGIL